MIDFVDERGEIRNVEHVAFIYSAKGTVRSNHYHRTNWHYLHVINGRMRYTERAVGGGDDVDFVVGTGGVVFTPPNREHRTEFLEDTLIISYAGMKPGGDYEADTVGVEW
jgi:quercetin dioxygenase-like cupin family protein